MNYLKSRMIVGLRYRLLSVKSLLSALALFLWCQNTTHALAQSWYRSHLRKVLLVDKKVVGNGYVKSSQDLIAALQALADTNKFEVSILAQSDNWSTISEARLAEFQAVIFHNNEGLDRIIPIEYRPTFEQWVRNGGGFIAIHMASAFIANWPFMDEALVQKFYGPHGSNKPTANLSHDPEGLAKGTETERILKGLTAPQAFLDEFISFQKSPRGEPGVTILATVDEASYSVPINGPMGTDHPVVWVKQLGKGRVVHNSLGFSWADTNVYAQKDGYLTKLLYNTLRYVAGDYVGCTDSLDATQSDNMNCAIPLGEKSKLKDGADIIDHRQSKDGIHLAFPSSEKREIFLIDISGKKIGYQTGEGRKQYFVPLPKESGVYLLKVTISGKSMTRRILVP